MRVAVAVHAVVANANAVVVLATVTLLARSFVEPKVDTNFRKFGPN